MFIFLSLTKKYLLHWKKASLNLPSASIRNSRTVGRLPKQEGLQPEVLSSLKRDYQCRHYKKCSLRGGFAYLGGFSPARFFQLGAIQTRQQPRGSWAEGLKCGIYWQSSRPSERVLATRDQCHLKQKRQNIFILQFVQKTEALCIITVEMEISNALPNEKYVRFKLAWDKFCKQNNARGIIEYKILLIQLLSHLRISYVTLHVTISGRASISLILSY